MTLLWSFSDAGAVVFTDKNLRNSVNDMLLNFSAQSGATDATDAVDSTVHGGIVHQCDLQQLIENMEGGHAPEDPQKLLTVGTMVIRNLESIECAAAFDVQFAQLAMTKYTLVYRINVCLSFPSSDHRRIELHYVVLIWKVVCDSHAQHHIRINHLKC